MNTMMYRGYAARIHYSEDDGCFVGHIADIHDIVGFHGETVVELRAAFEEAVDDYADLDFGIYRVMNYKRDASGVDDNGGGHYLVYQKGTRENPGQVVAVIWRETVGWRQAVFERDRQLVAEKKLAEGVDVICVKDDSVIPDARALEPPFKARMFAGALS